MLRLAHFCLNLHAFFLEHYSAHIADKTRAYAGCEDALDRLKASGAKLAVCTNKIESLARQLLDALNLTSRFDAGLTEQQFARIVIAYEPVWAIGTGKTATPDMAADAHRTIRSLARDKFGKDAADAVRILYGGSVKPDNTKTLMGQPEIDGVLVGGASLDAVSFASIVNF